MTRVPVAGKTKTRLMDVLTGAQCEELHVCFLKDIFAKFEHSRFEVFLTYTPEDDYSRMSGIVPGYIAEAFPQSGGDLGEKMADAMEHVKSRGYDKVVLIGSDVPQLEQGDIVDAFEMLDSCDAVLGPTLDGGYYLIGVKEVAREVFSSEMAWGGATVLDSTLSAAERLGIETGIVKAHSDIDVESDIALFKSYVESLPSGAQLPQNTIDYLKIIWGDIDV